ncbi:unnamed protein product [Mytilus coruscus]|uniref:Uncharacterized protein n=1 Tax=Mytilus coruscus TaxID=42192 RepID=A0A6J8C8E2_MYTCO|nr:unnamed protein product [Mytilus coruscus]
MKGEVLPFIRCSKCMEEDMRWFTVKNDLHVTDDTTNTDATMYTDTTHKTETSAKLQRPKLHVQTTSPQTIPSSNLPTLEGITSAPTENSENPEISTLVTNMFSDQTMTTTDEDNTPWIVSTVVTTAGTTFKSDISVISISIPVIVTLSVLIPIVVIILIGNIIYDMKIIFMAVITVVLSYRHLLRVLDALFNDLAQRPPILMPAPPYQPIVQPHQPIVQPPEPQRQPPVQPPGPQLQPPALERQCVQPTQPLRRSGRIIRPPNRLAL